MRASRVCPAVEKAWLIVAAGVIAFSLYAIATPADSLSFKSGPRKVRLIELYSSEGCRNCIPADMWMVNLKNSAKLWERFVPVSFHVDYWNHKGWVDPFSSDFFTSRQHIYLRLWGEGGVYTPCFVLDGAPWTGWTTEDEPPEPADEPAGILTVASTTNGLLDLSIHYKPMATNGEWVAYAALMGNNLRVTIGAGENAGLQLDHDFVALALEQKKMEEAEDGFHVAFSFAEARIPQIKRYSLAVWVSKLGELQPVQATGGFLP